MSVNEEKVKEKMDPSTSGFLRLFQGGGGGHRCVHVVERTLTPSSRSRESEGRPGTGREGGTLALITNNNNNPTWRNLHLARLAPGTNNCTRSWIYLIRAISVVFIWLYLFTVFC